MQEAHTIYPGALFNESVLYSPPGSGALFTAIAAEDCVLLRISHEQRTRMQCAPARERLHSPTSHVARSRAHAAMHLTSGVPYV